MLKIFHKIFKKKKTKIVLKQKSKGDNNIQIQVSKIDKKEVS